MTKPRANNFVHDVPDECDRIIWRDRYYHLPLSSNPAKLAALTAANARKAERIAELESSHAELLSIISLVRLGDDAPVQTDARIARAIDAAEALSQEKGG